MTKIYNQMLQGLKVVEFQGLAPTVFCGMYFADQGAQVTLVARPTPAPFSMPIHQNIMNRGKKCVCLNPKVKEQRDIIIQLIRQCDVVIDPYRPGVLEKLKLGPSDLTKINSKVILLRVSGYGQKGKMALRPGHDLNYLALAGIIPLINENNQALEFPTNFLADFVSSSLGVNAALAATQISLLTKQGGQIDCSLSEGCKYFAHLITSELPQGEPKKESFNTYFPTIEGQMYCVTSSLEEKQINNQLKQAVLEMKKERIEYLDKTIFQISIVKKIPAFDEQISGGLQNPFGVEKVNKSLPSRGEHTEQLRKIMKLSPNAKL